MITNPFNNSKPDTIGDYMQKPEEERLVKSEVFFSLLRNERYNPLDSANCYRICSLAVTDCDVGIAHIKGTGENKKNVLCRKEDCAKNKEWLLALKESHSKLRDMSTAQCTSRGDESKAIIQKEYYR